MKPHTEVMWAIVFDIHCSQMFTIVTSDQKSEVPLPILNNIWISTLVHMQIGGHNFINPIRVEDNRFHILHVFIHINKYMPQEGIEPGSIED